MMTARPGTDHTACAIDFGTSNSVVALCHGAGETEVVAAEPSCILITDDRSVQRLYVGNEAVARYRGSADTTRS